MNCPFCGGILPDGATFCDQCGNMLNGAPQGTPQQGPVPQQGGYGQVPPNMGQTGPIPQQGGYGQVPPPNMGQTGPISQQGEYGQVPPPNMGQPGPMPQPGPGMVPPPQQGGYGQMPPGQPYGQQPGNPKKSPVVPIIIISSIVVVAAVVVLLIVFLGKGKDGDGGDKTGEAVATEAPKKEEPTPEPTEEPTPEPEQETTSESAEEEVMTESESADDYSTDDRPNVGDFEWFYTLYYESKPVKAIKNFFSQSGAERISDPALVEGGWKAYMVGKPDVFHEEGYRYLNVIISNNDDYSKAQITFDWWTMGDSTGDESDESSYSDETHTCKWDSSNSTCKDSQLKMTNFIEMDDVQYGLGSYTWESGETDYVVLYREKRY